VGLLQLASQFAPGSIIAIAFATEGCQRPE
jgi:hypothetical protein